MAGWAKRNILEACSKNTTENSSVPVSEGLFLSRKAGQLSAGSDQTPSFPLDAHSRLLQPQPTRGDRLLEAKALGETASHRAHGPAVRVGSGFYDFQDTRISILLVNQCCGVRAPKRVVVVFIGKEERW